MICQKACFDKSHAGHYLTHLKAKETGDLPLTEEEILYALENTNNARVIETKLHKAKGNDGAHKVVLLALDAGDGQIILVEVASKSSGGLRLTSGWKNSYEKFDAKYGNLKSSPNGAGCVVTKPEPGKRYR